MAGVDSGVPLGGGVYRFLDVELDLARFELRRGGNAVATRPKVLGLIAYLVEQRQRAVSRTELLNQLWNGTAVGDAALSTVIKEARHAVGDTGSAQKVIRTVRGRGYRFVGKLSVDPSPTVGAGTSAVSTHAATTGSLQAAHAKPTAAANASAAASPGNAADLAGASPKEPTQAPGAEEYKVACVLSLRIEISPERQRQIGTESLHSGKQEVSAMVRRVASAWSGYVLETRGLRATIVFGVPLADEDYVRRGAAAALQLRAQLDQPARRLAGTQSATQPPITIGLHCGRLLVSGKTDADAPGLMLTSVDETQELAASLADCATFGQVLISDQTRQHLADRAEIRRVGPRGGAAADITYELIQTRDGPQLQDHENTLIGHPRPSGPLIGRSADLQLLRRLLGVAAEGRGQVIGIQGVPGIGKTRLVREFVDTLGTATRLFSARCASLTRSTPWTPMASLLRQAHRQLAREPETPRQWLGRLGLAPASAAGLTRLIDGESATCDAAAADLNEMSPLALRALIFDALTQWLERVSPSLLLLEDAHWIDATSNEWLTKFVERMARLPVLLLVTYRPEYQPKWIHKSYVTQHALQPLELASSDTLLDHAVGRSALSAATRAEVIQKAQGNPLFLEQLGQMLLRHGAGKGALPDTLQAMLGARIDRLGADTKRVLQLAAVCGQGAPFELLLQVRRNDARAVHRAIDELNQQELLYLEPSDTGPMLAFSHILIQEAAYGSLSAMARRRLHSDITDVLQHDADPALLAHHYAGSEQYTAALEQFLRAGEQANATSANREALQHVGRAMTLLPRADATARRNRLETGLQLVRGAALVPTQGYGAPEVAQAYARALQLCEAEPGSEYQYPVVRGLAQSCFLSGRFEQSEHFARRLLTQAQSGRLDQRLDALAILGLVYSHRGQILQAIEAFEQAAALYDETTHHALTFGAGHDPGALSMSFGALSHHWCGDFSAAMALSARAIGLTERLRHPFTTAMAHFARAGLASVLGDVSTCADYAARSVAISARYGFPHWLSGSQVLHGWARLQEGDATGLAEMQQGLAAQQQCGTRSSQTFLLAHLIEGQLLLGDVKGGQQSVAVARKVAQRTGECFYSTEIDRLEAELLLLDGHPEGEIRARLKNALSKARASAGGAWALRTAMSLARHYPTTASRQALRDALSRIRGPKHCRHARTARDLL